MRTPPLANYPLIRKLGLAPVFRLAAMVYYRWAMSEMHPLHPDMPDLVCRMSELQQLQ